MTGLIKRSEGRIYMWELLGSVKLPTLSYVTHFEKWSIEALARLQRCRVLLVGWCCGVLKKQPTGPETRGGW